MIICRISQSTGWTGACVSREGITSSPACEWSVCMEGGGSGGEGTWERKGKKDVHVSWTAEAKLSTKLGNGPAHDLSVPLSWYWRIFAEERPNCQVNFAVAGDEVKQSPIMLACSANCPAEVSPAVQGYWCVIQPKKLVMSGRNFNGVCLSCPQKRWNSLRGERRWELLMVWFYALTGNRLPSTNHCKLISYSKKWTFLFQSLQIYPSKMHFWCGLLWCFCLGPQYSPDICQSPLFYFPFCLLGSFPGLPLVNWLSDKDWISSARDYRKYSL